ncbi:MAG: sigma factor-like helix-turn-helix DNA-binding protein [Bacteroidales bacterium]
MLSRQKGLRYRDIASLQSISIKTVEKRISNALCSLRAGLQIFM